MTRQILYACLMVMLTGMMTQTGYAQNAVSQGKQIFEEKCSRCHSIGGGKVIGPDLKGVTERRDEGWLISFIRNSQKMINEGDETAKKVYNEFNQMTMPAHKSLSDQDIKNILAYIEQGGSSGGEKTAQKKTQSTETAQKSGSGGGAQGAAPLGMLDYVLFSLSGLIVILTIIALALSLYVLKIMRERSRF